MQRYRAASFWTLGSLYEEIWAVHKQEESNTLKDMEVQFFQFLTLNFKFFEISPSPLKNANIDNLILKMCNFGQFSPSESEKYGGNYHFFETFPSGGGGASDGLA